MSDRINFAYQLYSQKQGKIHPQDSFLPEKKKVSVLLKKTAEKSYLLLDQSAETLNTFLLNLGLGILSVAQNLVKSTFDLSHFLSVSIQILPKIFFAPLFMIQTLMKFASVVGHTFSKTFKNLFYSSQKFVHGVLPLAVMMTIVARGFAKQIFKGLRIVFMGAGKILKLSARGIVSAGRIYGGFMRSSDPREFFAKVSLSSLVVASLIWLLLSYPALMLRAFPSIGESVVTAVDENYVNQIEIRDIDQPLPPIDESLPEENKLLISKIGVDTLIREASEQDHEEAMRQGVWRVNDFATPVSRGNTPTILVAHRYGYLNWSNQFRRENSFYNLDKLTVGDRFEVIWDQRKFTFEVYKDEEGQDISDYSADMILYTCKHLNSPIRLFKYARVVESGIK